MFEPGVMFWAERDNLEMALSLGVKYGQLGIPGGMQLTADAAAKWKAALEAAGFTLVTVFAAYEGEDYTDMATVAGTVGFIPPATRALRLARTLEVSDFAAQLGVGSIACHVGFVPEDTQHPDYLAVRQMVRDVCDHAAKHGQNFALETGQEPAGVLLRFIRRCGPGQPADQLRSGESDSLRDGRADRGVRAVSAAGGLGALQGWRPTG